MNIKVKLLAILILSVALFVSSCSDPLNYEDVKKQKTEAGVIQVPDGYTEATIVGTPEKLSTLESVQTQFAAARVAILLEGETDTLYARVVSERQALWLFSGDRVFVDNDKLTLLSMKNLPSLVNGKIVSINSLLGNVVSVDVLMGNGYTPVQIRTTRSGIPEREFKIGKMLTIEDGRLPVGVLN